MTSVNGLTIGMATLPQGNQELLVAIDETIRPPGELGVSKSVECFDTLDCSSSCSSCSCSNNQSKFL